MVKDEELERLRTIRAAHETDLMRKANVVGVGIGLRQRKGEPTGEPVIVVSVTRKVPSSQLASDDVIPRELEGKPVDVQVVGELRALTSPLTVSRQRLAGNGMDAGLLIAVVGLLTLYLSAPGL